MVRGEGTLDRKREFAVKRRSFEWGKVNFETKRGLLFILLMGANLQNSVLPNRTGSAP